MRSCESLYRNSFGDQRCLGTYAQVFDSEVAKFAINNCQVAAVDKQVHLFIEKVRNHNGLKKEYDQIIKAHSEVKEKAQDLSPDLVQLNDTLVRYEKAKRQPANKGRH
mgnify:FL=1